MRRSHAAVRLLAAAALAGALAACGTTDPLSPDFGVAVRHNMMMHIIDPAPKHGQAAPEMSGPRAAGALHRYEQGKPTDLKSDSTTKSGK